MQSVHTNKEVFFKLIGKVLLNWKTLLNLINCARDSAAWLAAYEDSELISLQYHSEKGK